MLIATAGHIDHGKTSLVRALTGAETDRLPEERARGISIDLGFAYWPQVEGHMIGFVDVPGHERFIRNMLAGICGVDLALLIVAADDGVMPQTVEHLHCLDLLGVTSGLVAITKLDRVGPDRVMAVRAQIADLLVGTALELAPIHAVSVVTGDGVADLAQAIRAEALAPVGHDIEGRNFRLAIDRTFSVTGVGTIVTGTALSGAVRTGERLILSPQGLEVRVRGLQSAGQQTDWVRAGERCALNLAGVDRGQIHRGDWLVVPDMHAPTARIEARVKAFALRDEALKHHCAVHLHLRTADVTGRLLMPRQAAIPPGESAIVQIVLDQETSAVTGEKFVLRDASGRHLLGGGQVVDPFASGERRRTPVRAEIATAFSLATPEKALAALFEITGQEVGCAAFSQRFNLDRATSDRLFASAGAVILGKGWGLAVPAERVCRVEAQVLELLAAHHAAHPELGGMTVRDVRIALAEPISVPALTAILKDMSERRMVDLGNALAKLPGHSATFGDAEVALWADLVDWLDGRGPTPFMLDDAVRALRVREPALKAMLYRRCASGDLLRMDERRFYLRPHIIALAEAASRLAARAGPGGFGAAAFRDETGIGRNMVIRILEFLDRLGVTRRKEDMRLMAHDFRAVLGED